MNIIASRRGSICIEPLEARIAPAFTPILELSGLNGSNGFKLDGVADNDHAGASVGDAGDFNGDGFDDIIVGADDYDQGIASAGSAYLIFGKAGGFPANVPLSGLDGTNGFKVSGLATNSYTGVSVSGAGDVNGDGFDDVVIGAPYATGSGSNSGVVYVVFGKSGGFPADFSLSTLDGVNGFRIFGAAFDRAGVSVSGAGDFNNDGFADIIVGAPGSANIGAAYLVFGKANGFAPILDVATLNGASGFRLGGAASNDQAGKSVSGAGDVNGDGFDDVVIGASSADPGGNLSGASYVVFGRGGAIAPNLSLSALDGTNGFSVSGADPGDLAGYSVSGAGNINGDGFADVIVGAYRAPAGTASGAAYVILGKAGGFAPNISLAALNGTNGFRLVGVASADDTGAAVSDAGDINDDGFGDLLIGARNASPNGFRSGAAYVMFGKSGGFAPDFNLAALDGSNGFKLNGVAASDMAGDAVTGAGDVNGDGADDLIVGSFLAAGQGNSRGVSYVVFGQPAPSPLIVTTAADLANPADGVISLREAITFANSNPGIDTITFNIPGVGVQTIAVAAPLPAISEAVLIDGYSQPGASANTAANGSNAVILIELRSAGAPNGTDGLVFTADGNTVRGLAIGGFDGDGIELRSSNNRIDGSFIGLNAAGNAIVANGNPFVDLDAGIFVNEGSDNIIGGTTPAQRNVISGNNSHGVMIIEGPGPGLGTQNLVIGNVIGLAADGMTVLTDGQGFRGNRGAGVLIQGGSQNEIGGVDPAARNILSGNTSSGAAISGATGNIVHGNFIGLAADGATIAGNGTGVSLTDAPGNTIGGATASARNIISGNASGIVISGPTGGGNLVQGNLIGTDETGTVAKGNTNGVVVSDSPDNFIGGPSTSPGVAPGNVISGSVGGGGSGNGILISGAAGTGNHVQGNIIGLDITGTVDLGNDATGVAIGTGGSMTLVGGTDPGAGNVISGNRTGIAMSSGFTLSSSNVIQGNLIGTDITGTLDLGNDGDGIFSNASDQNSIGGTSAAARNVISGNNGAGIALAFAGATGNVIEGNYIGTDVTGTLDLGNSGDGIFIDRAGQNTVGGSTPGSGNLISGNDRRGVVIGGPAIDGTIVQGNLIGTQTGGSNALGNGEHGIMVTGFDATNTLLGGSFGNAGNTIAFNTGAGIYLEVGTGTSIRGNAIHSNSGLGIDLGTPGVTSNDPGDADVGPNNLQNFPVLISAIRSDPAGLVVTGRLNSTPDTSFEVDLYLSAAADPSGFGEGEIFLGTVNVNTDGNGDGSFTFNTNTAVAAGAQISAIATSATGETSEFSQVQAVSAAVPSISIADAAGLEGQSGTGVQDFQITLSAASTIPISVLVSTSDGTAIGDSDFTPVTGQPVQFAPGETSKVVSVDLLGDIVAEGNETFDVLLSGATNAMIGDGSAIGTIINDDFDSSGGEDVIFTDADGDEVSIVLSNGTLPPNALVFESTAQGFSLKSIDLTPDALAGGEINGSSLSIGAKLRPGGDGRVNVGRVDSTGIILKKLKIDGDVGLIEAGAIGSQKPAIKQLQVFSLGVEENNLFGGSPAGMLVEGGVGRIKVLTDVLNFAASIGVGQQSSLKQMVVGGQMRDSQFEIGGGFDSLKVKGALENSDFQVGTNFKKVSVQQEVSGGSFVVGGILNSATFKQGLKNTTFNAGQTIGSLIVVGDVENSTVRAGTALANFVVGGSLVDSTVSAPGKLLPRNGGDASAFKILGVRGDVVRSEIHAGYDRDGIPVNADANIGKVVINGKFEASNIVAGASAGADGLFGNADDTVIAGGNAVVAKIASIVIRGAILGTSADSTDHFGIVAEELGKVKADGTNLSLNIGPRNDLDGLALGGTDDVRAREVT